MPAETPNAEPQTPRPAELPAEDAYCDSSYLDSSYLGAPTPAPLQED